MELSVESRNVSRLFNTGRNNGVLKALDDVSIGIRKGELFGLLGPNGAGKTTLIKIFSTLLLPTSGSAYVGGYDVVKEANSVRKIINMISGGETPGYGILTVAENLWFFSQLYGIRGDVSKARVKELLEAVGLADQEKTRMNRLSSGMKQRLSVARAFMNDPDVLFLDEPTLGLDVISAKQIRGYVRNWVNTHPEKTVLLTTHYMAEADELCDRVGIIHVGRVIACDKPSNLKAMIRDKTVFQFQIAGSGDYARLNAVKGVVGLSWTHHIESDTSTLKVVLSDQAAVAEIESTLKALGSRVLSMESPEPTLEDVFIHLVGKGLE
jgi:ABC-2 type transport system ATP-binding protein